MKSTLLLFVIVIFASCSSTKNTNDATDKSKTNTTSAMEAKKMIENGFLKGTIEAAENESDCPYVIKVADKDGDYFLDPTNLDETFKKDGMEVWFTFRGLRMMNRCEKAAPVAIDKIEKRAE